METMRIITGKIRVLPLMLLTVFILALGACKDDEDDDDSGVVFKATINGQNEVPPNASAAIGDATLTFHEETGSFDIVVNYSGVQATGAHIHTGDPGVPGPVVFGFNQPVTSPIRYTSPRLDSTQLMDLNAGKFFVNIHSDAYPAGEIRGQLLKQ